MIVLNLGDFLEYAFVEWTPILLPKLPQNKFVLQPYTIETNRFRRVLTYVTCMYVYIYIYMCITSLKTTKTVDLAGAAYIYIYVYIYIYICLYIHNICIYIYIDTYPKHQPKKIQRMVYNLQRHAKKKTTCATQFEFPYARAASMEGKPVFAPQVCCKTSVLSNADKGSQWEISCDINGY